MTTQFQKQKKIIAAEKRVGDLEARVAKQQDLTEQLADARKWLEWTLQMPVSDEDEQDPFVEPEAEGLAVDPIPPAEEAEPEPDPLFDGEAGPEVVKATFSDAGAYAE